MSCNRRKPHILVLPEDDATRQIATGFELDQSINRRAIQVLTPVGGWKKVLNEFKDVHVPEMRQYPDRMIVLLIDFDGVYENRMSYVQSEIDQTGFADRVFVLGTLSEPEDLRKAMQLNFEKIGQSLAKDCLDNTRSAWGHDQLKHNITELNRMVTHVKPFLF